MLPGRFRDNATGSTSRAYVACAPRGRLMMMLVLKRVAALLLFCWAPVTAQAALEQNLTALCEAKIARAQVGMRAAIAWCLATSIVRSPSSPTSSANGAARWQNEGKLSATV